LELKVDKFNLNNIAELYCNSTLASWPIIRTVKWMRPRKKVSILSTKFQRRSLLHR